MSDENEPFRRLHELATAELDRSATPEQQDELRALLRDDAAARDLTLVEYYRHTYANKPEWQRF